MNLETIEQKCLAYLMQVSRPVVPVEQVLRFVQRDAELADVSERELVEFLRRHELFTVLDPIGLAADPAGAKALDEAGISIGPSVMLETRVPTKQQWADLMNEQLDTLLASLETAAVQALHTGDTQRHERISMLRERTMTLKARIQTFDGT